MRLLLKAAKDYLGFVFGSKIHKSFSGRQYCCHAHNLSLNGRNVSLMTEAVLRSNNRDGQENIPEQSKISFTTLFIMYYLSLLNDVDPVFFLITVGVRPGLNF